MKTKDFLFMREALKEAQIAFEKNEVPIGSIIVKNGIIIGKGHNLIECNKSAIYHAEILAIESASKYLDAWRLNDCTLYTTLEPCAMCAGAILNSRISRLVIAARDLKRGCSSSVLDITGNSSFSPLPTIEFGVLEDESILLLKKFFDNKRP